MADKSYDYPLDLSWSADEMATVIAFFNAVEDFNEKPKSVSSDSFLSAYRAFKAIVPSKAQEKQLDKEFEKVSGYSTYQAVQQLTKKEGKINGR